MAEISQITVDGTTYDLEDASARSRLDDLEAKQVLYFYQQTVSAATNAEILRITNAAITTDTVVLECTFADPSYITSDVVWTSYAGYIAFTGTCTAATTANVTLGKKEN